MIDQFYAVINDEDQYMYRSNDVWRGNPFPRATGCRGTEKDGQSVLQKVLDDQQRQVDQQTDSIFRWEHSTSGSKNLMIEHCNNRIATIRARTFRLVKVTVEIV